MTVHFGPEDDTLSETATLRWWRKQSYVAATLKKVGRVVA
jgi:hypothetical protein